MSIGLNPVAPVRPLRGGAARPSSVNGPILLLGGLSARELRRRVWHMSPGLLPFLLHLIPHRDPISPTLQGIILGCCLWFGYRILTCFRRIQRVHEGDGQTAVAGYALSVMLTVILFPQQLELGLAVLMILAFGDGSATLFGLMFRGPRLPWNAEKSWSGFLSFLVVGTAMTGWMYYGERLNPEAIDPPVGYWEAMAFVGPAVALAAIAESLPSRLNDNVRVGVTSSLMLITMHLSRNGLSF